MGSVPTNFLQKVLKMSITKENAPATPKQLWALFCGTGLNTKGMCITVRQASNLIGDMKAGIDIADELRSLGATGEVKKKVDFQSIYNEAHEAGMKAGNGFNCQPMTVTGHGNTYFVPDGVCGFAEIRFPGNTAWGRWAKKAGVAQKSYNGGNYIWVSEFGQSMQRKEAYARAFVEVLKKHNIEAYSTSRMD